jgi:hypothetical protein
MLMTTGLVLFIEPLPCNVTIVSIVAQNCSSPKSCSALNWVPSKRGFVPNVRLGNTNLDKSFWLGHLPVMFYPMLMDIGDSDEGDRRSDLIVISVPGST